MYNTLDSHTQPPILNHSIIFSSTPSHALHARERLCSNDNQAFHPCVDLYDDGWVRSPSGQLLLWVPVDKRKPFYHPWTRLIIPRGGVEMDLSQMAYGFKWQECFGL